MLTADILILIGSSTTWALPIESEHTAIVAASAAETGTCVRIWLGTPIVTTLADIREAAGRRRENCRLRPVRWVPESPEPLGPGAPTSAGPGWRVGPARTLRVRAAPSA